MPAVTPAHPQPLTRRAALDAERGRTRTRTRTGTGTGTRRSIRPRRVPAPTPVADTANRNTAVRVTADPPPRRTRSALTALAAVAACALFASGALPQAATAAPAVTAPIIAAAVTARPQQFTARYATDATVARDAFGVSMPGTAGPAVRDASGTGAVQWPFPGQVPMSSAFGRRSAPCASCSTSHQGLDLTPGAGTPIGAVAAGTVRISGMHSEFGQYAVIDHIIGGRRISTLYAHMQAGSSPLRAGQQVQAGQLVGLVGNTGRSTGAHLHLQVQLDGVYPVDPLAWLRANAGNAN